MKPTSARNAGPSYARSMREAVEAHRAGRFAEAERAYLAALRRRPGDAEALRLCGAVYLEAGRGDLAEKRYREALSREPESVEACLGLGRALDRLGRLQEAAAACASAVRLAPDDAAAISALGLVCEKLGRRDEALTLLGRAARLRPEDGQAQYLLAEVLRKGGRAREAAAFYEKALRLDPGHVPAVLHLGLALIDDGRLDAAVAWYEAALRQSPGDVLLRNDLGHALRLAGRRAEAREHFAAVLEREPDFLPALVNFAVASRDMGDNAAAEAACGRALAEAPDLDAALLTLGALRQDAMRHEEAVALFDRVLSHVPDNLAARWNKALSLLSLGRLAEGFALYEVGLGQKDLRGLGPDPARRLDGLPRPGERLLLWAEQGLGDSMQFVRYAALCKARGAEVALACPPALHRLLAGCPGVDAVCADPAEAVWDRHASLMSLPLAFGTTLATVPADIPYLFVSDEARAAWGPRFAGDGRPRVGLVWAGSPRGRLPEASLADRRRSLRLERLLPLLSREDVAYYSLQKDEAAGQVRELGLGGRIVDLMDGVSDFMDTAAIVERLDLVITVDTSVAHLAGALGRPVWLLSRFDACWRWLGNREPNPWYPAMRIFGQPSPGDWDAVVARAARELAGWRPA